MGNTAKKTAGTVRQHRVALITAVIQFKYSKVQYSFSNNPQNFGTDI